jgi:hydrogenase-4 component B
MMAGGATTRRPRAGRAAAALIVAGCVAGLPVALPVLLGAAPRELQLPWLAAFGGAFALRLDALAAAFMVPLCLVCALAAVYGLAYLGDASDTQDRRRQRAAWGSTLLLAAGMALVLLARNALLFLAAWEITALSSFMLVAHEDEKPEARRAGTVYLAATHVGTLFLLVFFMVAAKRSGSLDFDDWRTLAGSFPPRLSAWLFICLLIGFGTKAGFIPLHVWLPEAHPAAPSHVSAVMSGVMIKAGIYGLLRLLPVLGAPPLWQGWALVATGLVSGLLGVLFALAQHDIKRLLAYHSVENIGIIALGMGIGCLGLAGGRPTVATLGFAGALLHVFNHAVFKSLLFLGAGAVVRATGTREIDRLGGLMKRMPLTGLSFLVGSAAICGLPPLNGFGSEFLIYLGGLSAAVGGGGAAAAAGVAAVAGLAMIGALAAACFAKLFGIVFLGAPRHDGCRLAGEAPAAMRRPMCVLAAICCLVTPCLALATRGLLPAVAVVTGACGAAPLLTPAAARSLRLAGLFAAGLAPAAGLAVLARRRPAARRPAAEGPTWDCGYAAPTARMQYTAFSFARPLVSLFAFVLRDRTRLQVSPGYFPAAAKLATRTADPFREEFYLPLFRRLGRRLSVMKRLQEGRVQRYVLYIVLTLLALLAWTLGTAR